MRSVSPTGLRKKYYVSISLYGDEKITYENFGWVKGEVLD